VIPHARKRADPRAAIDDRMGVKADRPKKKAADAALEADCFLRLS
jgi:hypothetical protein